MMDPKLKTLLTVCETGSFTRAAQALCLSQPAVSQHIKQLEQEYGLKIFSRTENELKPTRQGKIVITYAKRISALYQNLEQSIVDEKRNTKRITIGMTHTEESNIIAEALAKYCSENAGLRIRILSDYIKTIYEKLRNYEIDLAIVEGKATDPGFSSLLLDTDCLVLAVSNNNHLAKKNKVTLAELKKEKMILRLPNSATRNLFVSHLESNNSSIDEFNVMMEVDNIAMIKDLVRRGFGVSILAKSACLDELKKGRMTVLPIENLSMVREINLVYQRDFEHAEILRGFVKIYSEMVKLYRPF